MAGADSTDFLLALQQMHTFEEASTATLSEVLSLSVADTHATDARAVIHLRTNDAYQHVVAAEAPSKEIGKQESMPSTNAWKWVKENKCVVIDANLALVRELGAEAEVIADVRNGQQAPGTGIDPRATRKRLLDKLVTHLVAWPLCAPGGVLGGMLSLELACRERIGKAIFTEPGRKRLTTLVGMAAPYLISLPPGKTAIVPDELLPVVGKRTTPLIETLRMFSILDDTLLLIGPTGVGKSKLARYIHAHSRRNAGPFETVDLGSVPEDLQLAQLFGWQRGAFTGAVKETAGAVARARGGTLFVDEIDKLSLQAQAGTLRLFDERKYRSLGDEQELDADIRLIAGTNADLRECVRKGTFREDLLYRISVLPMQIPSLDDRSDEVEGWATYFLHRVDSGATWDEASIGLLISRRWPGNLRQLDNIVRRSLAISRMRRGTIVIKPADVLEALGSEPESGGGVADHLARAARVWVEKAKRTTPVDLEVSAAFAGFIMAAALEVTESDSEALRLLGQRKVLDHRNLRRTVRNHVEKAKAMCQELGERFPFEKIDKARGSSDDDSPDPLVGDE